MPCYHPLTGYRSKLVNASGKRSIVFNEHQGFKDLEVKLPCGRCIGCRLERSRQVAVRCLHEAQLHDRNAFLTLTYSPENLPENGSLVHDDFQRFMKRLRKVAGSGVRYLMCGEYGEEFSRPHYHALVFNYDFPDRKYWKMTPSGFKIYRSPTLEKLWTVGHSSVGDVTFESAAYVARYVTKKVTGKNALHHYNEINIETGEILSERRPEYSASSKRPGIGLEWLNKYAKDVYPSDFIVMRGMKMKPPKYYNYRFEMAYPSDYEKVKALRKNAAKKHEAMFTFERRLAGEFIKNQKALLLKRGYENDR